jgi:hypothetical protein
MQKNIDFGTFPDDPSADPIRTAFQKTQENFAELFQNQTNTGVSSINRNPGAGITVNRPTGDVILSANIACVKVYSSSLSVSLLGSPSVEPPSNASITQSSQTMVIDLPANISGINNISITGNITTGLTQSGALTVTGNANIGNISTGIISATGNITGNYILGNGAFLTGVSGSGGVANTVSDNAQPNITSVGTLTSLSIAGNAYIGNIGNVQILGGSANNLLTTDGTGNLSWSNITTVVPNIIWDSAKSLMLFKAPNENIYNLGNVSTSPVSVDWTDYNNYYATLETNTTFEFAGIQQYDNLNPISMIASVTLYLKQDIVGNRTITWPVEVKWPSNAIPTSSVTANAIDIYTFLTYDGGNTIIGLQQVKGIV